MEQAHATLVNGEDLFDKRRQVDVGRNRGLSIEAEGMASDVANAIEFLFRGLEIFSNFCDLGARGAGQGIEIENRFERIVARGSRVRRRRSAAGLQGVRRRSCCCRPGSRTRHLPGDRLCEEAILLVLTETALDGSEHVCFDDGCAERPKREIAGSSGAFRR